jgi:ribose 5-phosphate isomerase A
MPAPAVHDHRSPRFVMITKVMTNIEREKQLAAEAAAQLVEDGMTVGLGTGSTAAYLLAPLARRGLEIRCVATSPPITRNAVRLGLEVVEFAGDDAPSHLDITIDGADQVDRSGWLVKGGGGAHTREKIVAAAASRFVVIVSSNKLVEELSPPIPLELSQFGLASTVSRLGRVRLRNMPLSPDGGVIADYLGPVDDPEALATRLSATPGIVQHGLFASSMVADVVVGRGDGVKRIHVDTHRVTRAG